MLSSLEHNAQNIALSYMVKALRLKGRSLKIMKPWDTLILVHLTDVWEQTRRDLFQAAVEQRRWNVVKKWADHTLYNDQRWWAIEEAYKEKQWQVMLLLADHGLPVDEQMLVHNRLGKFADWDTMLDMFEHGVDVREIRELLQAARMKRKEKKNHAEYSYRAASLHCLEQCLLSAGESFETLLCRRNWRSVLHRLRICHNEQHFQQTLQRAVENRDWHMVIQLIRLDMGMNQRDAFFTEMFQQSQWDVLRELLEKGVSIQLCLDALPQLLRKKQWMLVARIMDYDVNDSTRREVMGLAMEQREGSLVWHCMSALKTSLSVEERVTMFQQAFIENNWQAVKALIDTKDETGTHHRDVALQEAIKQHRWDVVDHCQRHHADIDMKDEDGENAMHRAARQKDWTGLVELVSRGADQRLLDKHGSSALHKALEPSDNYSQARDEDIRTLIKFHAPLNQTDKNGITPLEMLIHLDKGELIDLALMWSPDLHKGITKEGKTVLHAACASGCWQSLYYLIQRGANPLAVTAGRETSLYYAVRSKSHEQKVLVECIRLGLSTHQPAVTDACFQNIQCPEDFVLTLSNERSDSEYLLDAFLEESDHVGDKSSCDARQNLSMDFCLKHMNHIHQFHCLKNISPLAVCVEEGKRVLLQMLYESGSCSNRELFVLYIGVLSIFVTRSGEYMEEAKMECRRIRMKAMLPVIKQMATTPRSLKSKCRLAISHSLNVRGRRHRVVAQLPVLDEDMKKYIMFDDLKNPAYGGSMKDWENRLAVMENETKTCLDKKYWKNWYHTGMGLVVQGYDPNLYGQNDFFAKSTFDRYDTSYCSSEELVEDYY